LRFSRLSEEEQTRSSGKKASAAGYEKPQLSKAANYIAQGSPVLYFAKASHCAKHGIVTLPAIARWFNSRGLHEWPARRSLHRQMDRRSLLASIGFEEKPGDPSNLWRRKAYAILANSRQSFGHHYRAELATSPPSPSRNRRSVRQECSRPLEGLLRQWLPERPRSG
jgi:hypothetical protein